MRHRDADNERVAAHENAFRATVSVDERFSLLDDETDARELKELVSVHDVRI